MSGPIAITTSTYDGPERRGIMNETHEQRQSNEIAIARLEVNVEYIKQAVDEIKKIQSCVDYVSTAAFQAHLEDHRIHANTKWDRYKFSISTVIAVGALLMAALSRLPVAH